MKLWSFLLIIPVLTLSACGIFPNNSSSTEFSDSISAKPITPSHTVTREERIQTITNAITTMQNLYGQIQEAVSQNTVSSKGKKEAAKFETNYGSRIKEITELSLNDLSEEELRALSLELSDIVSALRETLDLF